MVITNKKTTKTTVKKLKAKKTYFVRIRTYHKIAFVGVDKREQRQFGRIKTELGVMISFFSDYKKAKEWSLNKG